MELAKFIFVHNRNIYNCIDTSNIKCNTTQNIFTDYIMSNFNLREYLHSKKMGGNY